MLKLPHNCTHLTLAPHSSTSAWKIQWMEEPGRLQSMGSLRVGQDWATSLWLFTVMHWRRNGNPLHCSCLENPGGLPSMGTHRVGHDWSDLAAAAAAHPSKVMLKILQSRLQKYVNHELPDVQADFRKGRGTKDQTSAGSWKKQESSRKTSTSALLTMPKQLTMWITMGIPDHILRHLYAGLEATVRTGHGTTDWFQIGKGVSQDCILSPCLFNL